ncbi:MAG: ATP-dependent helicase [Candidatus Omnitrophica bacterium]|nr:ATP-dependent helicase [Candidatus Omnitrophota bacterium]
MSGDILKDLNEEQRQSVVYIEGPLLIIAGAGTGKTSVITRKIAYLIKNGLASQDEILALTFTDRAAAEMTERVDILVPYGYTDIWISTFHAFGDKILRENAVEIGLNPDFKVLTRPEAAVLVRQHLFDFPLDYLRPASDPTKFINDILRVFSRLRDEDVSVEEYKQFLQKLTKGLKDNEDDPAHEFHRLHKELSGCFATYLNILHKEGKVDFANQFYLALAMLRKYKKILEFYQNKFKYILIDEFQDTNYAQFQLVKLLAEKHKNITVVADDDQSIYRFRGAAYSNILSFDQTYPDAKRITLIRNYRSQQAILDSAYRLIQFNNPDRFEVKSKIDKRLIGREKEKEVTYLHFDRHSNEADQVAKIIKEKVRDAKYSYDDIAILVRSNNDADEFISSLNMVGIPWRFSGNQGLYSRSEVKLCISFLRFMANISDSLSLYYLAASAIYKIPTIELGYLNSFARRRNYDLFWCLRHFNEIEELREKVAGAAELIQKFTEELEKFLACSLEVSTGRLLYLFLTQTKFLKDLVKHPSVANEEKVENLARFFEIVKEFEGVAHEDRVVAFIEYLDMLIRSGDDPATVEADLDIPAVNISTVHKAKGLEFKVVFMVGLVNGRFPWPKRRNPLELAEELIKEVLPEGDFHIQEERRLFYVGMTRAKDELIFTNALDYGGMRLRKPSGFIFEALGKEKKQIQAKIKSSALESIHRFKEETQGKKTKQTPKKSDSEILRLSFYQIDDYLTCPLKYKYVHILHVPILTHHTVVYGKALHDAVAKYLQFKIKNNTIPLKELIDTFDASFSDEGFLSKEHRQNRKALAHEALKRFYKQEESAERPPTFVEKDFSFTLDNNRIVGRWDRVDFISKQEAVIIDYKSSHINKQKDADRKAKLSLQLAIYAMAFNELFGFFPKQTELHFLESSLVGRDSKDEKAFKKAHEEIAIASAGIRSGKFDANPSYMACNYCAYREICNFAKV